MALTDIFNSSKIKQENEDLLKQIEVLNSMLTPEMKDAVTLHKKIEELHAKKTTIQNELSSLNQTIFSLNLSISQKKEQLIQMDEEILMQEFGLYTPQYDFANSEQYKNKLIQIRQKQKDMIKVGTAATGNMNWTVNNSAQKGKKMVKDMQKLLIRAFNSECDDVIFHVKYNNYEASLKQINVQDMYI